jgi:hypothetical protein
MAMVDQTVVIEAVVKHSDRPETLGSTDGAPIATTDDASTLVQSGSRRKTPAVKLEGQRKKADEDRAEWSWVLEELASHQAMPIPSEKIGPGLSKHINTTELLVRCGTRGSHVRKTKITGFYALQSQKFPCNQLVAIQVADPALQSLVDHNFIMDITGRWRETHRTPGRVRQFCSEMQERPDEHVAILANSEPGLLEACTNLFYAAVKGGSIRLVEVLHTNRLLNPYGLKLNRENISRFYRLVPEVNVRAFVEWTQRHHGRVALSLAIDSCSLTKQGKTYFCATMFAVAYNGDYRRCVVMVDVYPCVAATAPVKRKMLLEWLARYIPAARAGEMAGIRVVGVFSDGDATEKAVCRLIAEQIWSTCIVVRGTVPEGVSGIDLPTGKPRRSQRFSSAVPDGDDDGEMQTGERGIVTVPVPQPGPEPEACLWRGPCFFQWDLAHILALAQGEAADLCLRKTASEVNRIKREVDAQADSEKATEPEAPEAIAARLGASGVEPSVATEDVDALPTARDLLATERMRSMDGEVEEMAQEMLRANDSSKPTTIMAAAYAFAHGVWAVRTSTGRLLKAKFESEGLREFHAPLPNDTRASWLAMGLLCAFLARIWRYFVRLFHSAQYSADPDVIPWRRRLHPLMAKLNVESREEFLALGRQIEAFSVWCSEVMHPALRMSQKREMPGHAAYIANLTRETAQVALAWHSFETLPQKLLPTGLGRVVVKRLMRWWAENGKLIEVTELITTIFPTFAHQYTQGLRHSRAGPCSLVPFWGESLPALRVRIAARVPAIVSEFVSLMGSSADRLGSTRFQSGYRERTANIITQLADLVARGLPTTPGSSAIVSSEEAIREARALDEEAMHLVDGNLYDDFASNVGRTQFFLSVHYPAAADFLYGLLAITLVEAPLEATQSGITLTVTPHRNQLLPLTVAGITMLRSTPDLIPPCCETLKAIALRVPAGGMDHVAVIAEQGGPASLDMPYLLDTPDDSVPLELPAGDEALVDFIANIARVSRDVALAYRRVALQCDPDAIQDLEREPMFVFREFVLHVGAYPADEFSLALDHARHLLHRIRSFKQFTPRREGFYFRLMSALTEDFRVVCGTFQAADLQAMFQHPDVPPVWAEGGMSVEMISALRTMYESTSATLGRFLATEGLADSESAQRAQRLLRILGEVF